MDQGFTARSSNKLSAKPLSITGLDGACQVTCRGRPSLRTGTCHVVLLPYGIAAKGFQYLLMLADIAQVAGYPVIHRVPEQQHVHWLMT